MMNRKWFEELLTDQVVTVAFVKKDGTERNMRCTLMPEWMPDTVVPAREGSTQRAKSEKSVSVYDLDINSWRAFSIESVKSITFGA
jgi:hypothetical protein